ncbi:MAG TPA: hypothetical protein HA349_00560 [Methanotrichaceae archaeon]|nr:hypothetical protein [Methanotrichaceae archaeon]
MCRWCVRYQKIERLTKTIEDAYGPQSCDLEEETGKRKREPESAGKSASS